jgi:hypothetical protein
MGTHKTSISRESATKRNGIGRARARDEVRRNGTIHRLHTVENGIEARKYPEVEPQLTYLPYCGRTKRTTAPTHRTGEDGSPDRNYASKH